MHKLSVALAVLGSAFTVPAQTCPGTPAQQTFSNRQQFLASFWYNLGSYLFDLDVEVPITIAATKTWLFDAGTGNPVVPNQVGNVTTVEVYTCPTTRLGNERLAPSSPGSPWTLLGSGQLVVADPNLGDGESTTTFNPPLYLPAGQYGMAFVFHAPTTGINPGPLHCLGRNPSVTTPVTDSGHFLTFANDAIVDRPWLSLGLDSPNLRILFTPAANSAQFVTTGEGCYFSPQAFYESFPNSALVPDLAHTSLSLVRLGASYQVAAGTTNHVTPASQSLTLGPPGASSSANWDDALSFSIPLPFTFPFPGGSTPVITVASNGAVLLDAVANSSYAVCGASYGDIAPFRDGPARLAAYHHDLDPTVGGGIYVDFDPANHFVRITWDQLQEWGVPAAVNTMQMTLHDSGNVDIVYGSLGNQSNSNNAIVGFTPGHGARLPVPQDLSATIPFASGNGTIPPVLTMSARPVLGTTPDVLTTDILPGTSFSVFLAGLAGIPGGTSLAPFGMPGCSQYVTPFVASLVGRSGGDFVVPFSIPNHASYQGVQFYFQSAPLTPNVNTAGVLTSNGLCVKLGQ